MYLFLTFVLFAIFIAVKGLVILHSGNFDLTFSTIGGFYFLLISSMLASSKYVVYRSANKTILLTLNMVLIALLITKDIFHKDGNMYYFQQVSSYVFYVLLGVFFIFTVRDLSEIKLPLYSIFERLNPWVVMIVFFLFIMYLENNYILLLFIFIYLTAIFKLLKLRTMKIKITFWVIAIAIPTLLLMYLIGFLTHGVMNQYSSIPHGYYKSEAELKGHVLDGAAEVSGRYFKIPRKYFMSGDINYAQKIHALYLRLNWSDFKPRGYGLDKKKMIKTSNGNTVKEYLTLTGAITVEEPRSDKYFFKRLFESKGRNVPLTPMKIEEIPQGLEGYIFHGYNLNNLIDHSNIYIIKDGDLITDLIICGIKNRNNSCNHRFYDKGLNYNIRYNKDRYFSKWEEMQKSAIHFVESFEVFPNFEDSEKGKAYE